MLAPHTVTIFNGDQPTVLRGVFLDTSRATAAQTDGQESEDKATLFIPFDVMAVDALTGTERAYARPKKYKVAEDKTAIWTLDDAGTFFAKGEIREAGKYQAINASYDDVYRITSVRELDFGGRHMRHWQCGGK